MIGSNVRMVMFRMVVLYSFWFWLVVVVNFGNFFFFLFLFSCSLLVNSYWNFVFPLKI